MGEFGLNPYIFGTFADGTPKGISLAGYGVSIFFVLSGFLITYLLLSEKEIKKIGIRKFYIRRILRIWPLYYLYLFISLIVIVYEGVNWNSNSLFFYLFYMANVPFITGNVLPFLAHYWSLGVEEQFYLFWPWVVEKIKYIEFTVVLMILFLIGTKVFLHLFNPGTVLETVIHVTRFHCMLIGALGAIFYKNNNSFLLKIADNKAAQLLCWVVILLAAINKFQIASFIDNEIVSVIALFLIIGQINIKNRLINLELGVFDFLGKISYGIYVYHPLLIFLFANLLLPLSVNSTAKYIIVYFTVTGTTVLMSYLSYNYFEKYFLRLKNKFVVVASSASKGGSN